MKYSTLLFTFFCMTFLNMSAQNNTAIINLKSADYELNANINSITYDDLEMSKYMDAYYVYAHFQKVPTSAQKTLLVKKGINILGFISNNTFLVKIKSKTKLNELKDNSIDGLYVVMPKFKMDYQLASENFPEHAVNGSKVKVIMQTLAEFNNENIINYVKSLNGEIISKYDFSHLTTINIDQDQLINLASHPLVKYLEPIDPDPVKEDRVGRTNHRVNWIGNKSINGISYNGSGVWMSIGDDGEIGPHIDFTGRVDQSGISSSRGSHGDHVAGIAIGAGNLDPRARGMAWGADLRYKDVFDAIFDAPIEYINPGIVATSLSYGNGCNAGYTSFAQTVDQQVRQMPNLMHIFSSGNSGTSNCGYGAGSGWGNITGGNKSAKNVIAVGNLNEYDILAGTSSRGPATDGRIKPDVCANGTQVYSVFPNNSYVNNSGTSMAAPGASGTYTALVHAFKELNSDTVPPSALMKATMMNTADDLGNKGPDFSFGWGRINARKALEVFENNTYVFDTISQGDTNSHTIPIPSNVKELKVMVYWNDYEAASNATTALVNNLDMNVDDGSPALKLPYILNSAPNASTLNSPATNGVDNLNNMEQVVLENPAAGSITVNVIGKTIPQGPQGYVVVYTYLKDDIIVTYPAGGESLTPYTVEVIRWDTYDTTGSFAVEYSADSGSTWTTLATVFASRRFFNWTVPNTVSSQALIKVSRNGISGESQLPFNIMSEPTNLNITSVCPNDFTITWNPVTGATAYDVYILGNKFMDSVMTVTTNSAVVSHPLSSETWVSVSAKGGNAKSERAIAIFKAPVTKNCVLNDDVKIEAVLNPGGNSFFDCINNNNMTVKVLLKNSGLTPKTNINLTYKFNGVSSVVENFSDTIAPNDTASFTFSSTINLTSGVNQFAVYLDSSDQNIYNDTIYSDFEVYTSTSVTAPYDQPFDGFGNCGTSQNCELEVCNLTQGWLNLENTVWDDFDFRVNAGGTPSTGTGPANDNTQNNSTGKYLYIESSACFDKTAELITPCLDLTSGISPEASIYYHMYGTDMGDLHFDVLHNGLWIEDVITPIIGNQGNQWKQAKIDLTPYIGTKVNVKFRILTGSAFTSDIALDDFKLVDTLVTAINENALAGIKIYPNPTQGIFYVDFGTEVSNTQMELFDVKGQLIFTQTAINRNEKIDLSNQNKGIYFLKITSKGQIKNMKIVVQ